MNKKHIGVFISGRGSNLESIINACKDENFPAKVVCVFSDNANAAGLQFASKNNINTHTLDLNNFESKVHYEEEILKLLKPYNIELICLAGYMKIITDKLISRNTRNMFFNQGVLISNIAHLVRRKNLL